MPETHPVIPQANKNRTSPFELFGLVIKAMRPKQWTKNLIAYAPLLFSMHIHEMHLFALATACVVAFCLVSGAIYLLNDVLDAEADRHHPTKCKRPIASGKLPTSVALFACALAIIAGVTISFFVRPTLAVVTLAYLALSLLYTTKLKHTVIIDVFAIAGGFVLRAVAGAVAVSVPTSGWFLLCTSLGALFLALEKRRQELNVLGDKSLKHRRSLGLYSQDLLDRLESIIVPSLVTSYAFYSFQSSHGEAMLLTVPFVLYGVMRYMLLSVHSTITGSPEEVLFKDKPIQATILLWVIMCALVIYQGPTWLMHWSDLLDKQKAFQWIPVPTSPL